MLAARALTNSQNPHYHRQGWPQAAPTLPPISLRAPPPPFLTTRSARRRCFEFPSPCAGLCDEFMIRSSRGSCVAPSCRLQRRQKTAERARANEGMRFGTLKNANSICSRGASTKLKAQTQTYNTYPALTSPDSCAHGYRRLPGRCSTRPNDRAIKLN